MGIWVRAFHLAVFLSQQTPGWIDCGTPCIVGALPVGATVHTYTHVRVSCEQHTLTESLTILRYL